jgi:hypothetical protein
MAPPAAPSTATGQLTGPISQRVLAIAVRGYLGRLAGRRSPALRVSADQPGNGGDLTKVTVHGSSESALRFSSDYYPGQRAQASLFFGGGQNSLHGPYLQTVPDVQLNGTTTPASGYIVEAGP